MTSDTDVSDNTEKVPTEDGTDKNTNSANNNKNNNNDTPPEICKRFKTIYTSIISMREHNNTTKQLICSSIGKTDINSILASDIKTCTKLSKQVLGEYILKSINLSDELCAPKSVESLSVNLDPLPSNFDLDSVQKVVSKAVSDTLDADGSKFHEIEQQLLTLKLKIDSFSSISVDDNSKPTPVTASPHIKESAPTCDPYVSYTENVVAGDLHAELLKFLADNKDKFTTVGESRDVLYFGEYGYRYGGVYHEACETPAVIQDLLDCARPTMTKPNDWMNSCLINRYTNGTKHIPPHRDDEPYIDPESEIVTVSLGCTRPMKFVNNTSTVTKELPLADSSVLITSRFAQDFWVHSIDADDSISDIRYSFTFRYLSPYFANSTLLIGDSNTKHLEFGPKLGKFGHRMPGKQMSALHIEQIPEPQEIGPYRKVVIHTGINNVKAQNRKSNRTLVNELESKCANIHSVYPKCKIYLSMILPTKSSTLNYRVRDFNQSLVDMAHAHKNIFVIEHPGFIGEGGLLKNEYGRFKDRLPNDIDVLHLGKMGIRKFAKQIKETILKRNFNNTRKNNDRRGSKTAVTGPPAHHRDGYQPTSHG